MCKQQHWDGHLKKVAFIPYKPYKIFLKTFLSKYLLLLLLFNIIILLLLVFLLIMLLLVLTAAQKLKFHDNNNIEVDFLLVSIDRH